MMSERWKWVEIIWGHSGPRTDSSFYPKGNGKSLQGFKQSNNVIWLAFWQDHCGAVLETDWRGANLEAQNQLGGDSNNTGDRWWSLRPGWWQWTLQDVVHSGYVFEGLASVLDVGVRGREEIRMTPGILAMEEQVGGEKLEGLICDKLILRCLLGTQAEVWKKQWIYESGVQEGGLNWSSDKSASSVWRWHLKPWAWMRSSVTVDRTEKGSMVGVGPKRNQQPLASPHVGRDKGRLNSSEGGERSASADGRGLADFRVGSPHQKLPICPHSNVQDPSSSQSCPKFSMKLCKSCNLFLGGNLHTVKFIHLKYTIRWFLVHLQI